MFPKNRFLEVGTEGPFACRSVKVSTIYFRLLLNSVAIGFFLYLLFCRSDSIRVSRLSLLSLLLRIPLASFLFLPSFLSTSSVHAATQFLLLFSAEIGGTESWGIHSPARLSEAGADVETSPTLITPIKRNLELCKKRQKESLYVQLYNPKLCSFPGTTSLALLF